VTATTTSYLELALPQVADDRVDRLEAVKRRPRDDEVSGATIDVWIIGQD